MLNLAYKGIRKNLSVGVEFDFLIRSAVDIEFSLISGPAAAAPVISAWKPRSGRKGRS